MAINVFIPNLTASDAAVREVQARMRDIHSASSRHEATLAAALGAISGVQVGDLPTQPDLSIESPEIKLPEIEAAKFDLDKISPPVLDMGDIKPVVAPQPTQVPNINLDFNPPVLPDNPAQFSPLPPPPDITDGLNDLQIPSFVVNIPTANFDTSGINGNVSPQLTDIPAINIDLAPPIMPAPVEPPKKPEFTIPTSSFVVSLPSIPTFTPDGLVIAPPPPPVDISGLMDALDFSDLQLPEAPIAPEMREIAPPQIEWGVAPAAPSIDLEIELPDVPEIELPELEEMFAIELPDFPEIEDIEEFDSEELPKIEVIEEAAAKLDITIGAGVDKAVTAMEASYRSQYAEETNVMRQTYKVIDSWVRENKNPWSGLPAAIEDALFNRTVDRENQNIGRAVGDAISEWAARGFSMPQGMLEKQISSIRDQGSLRVSEANREVLAQSFPKQIEQLQQLITQGMDMEQRIYQRFKDQQEMTIGALKYQIDCLFKAYDAKVSLYNAQNESYRMLFDVYKLGIETAMFKLKVFRDQVEALGLMRQVNQQTVDIFKTKLDAITSHIEIYKSQLQGATLRAEVMKSQFDMYKSQVQAYAEGVGAEKAKVDVFESQVKAETARIGVFESLSRSYATTIQGMGVQADMRIKGSGLRIEAAKVKLQEFGALVDAHKTNISEQVAIAQSNTGNFIRQVELFKAAVQHNIEVSDSQTKHADMQVRALIAGADIESKFIDVQSRAAIAGAELQGRHADVQSRIAIADLDARVRHADMVSRNNSSNADIDAKYADINLRANIGKADIDIKVAEANARMVLGQADAETKYADMRTRATIAQGDMITRAQIATGELAAKYAETNSRAALGSAEVQGKFAEIVSRAETSNLDAQIKYADLVTRTNSGNTEASIRAAEANARINAGNVEVITKYADMNMRTAVANAEARSRHMDITSRTNIAMADVQARFSDMKSRTNIAQSELYMKQYDSSVQQMMEKAKIAMEAAKAVGQLSAQLAAGAMSAMHVSASISGSASQSQSYNGSQSESESTNHNYNY